MSRSKGYPVMKKRKIFLVVTVFSAVFFSRGNSWAEDHEYRSMFVVAVRGVEFQMRAIKKEDVSVEDMHGFLVSLSSILDTQVSKSPRKKIGDEQFCGMHRDWRIIKSRYQQGAPKDRLAEVLIRENDILFDGVGIDCSNGGRLQLRSGEKRTSKNLTPKNGEGELGRAVITLEPELGEEEPGLGEE